MAARWRIFHTEINLKPDTATIVTTAAVLLHNFCLSKHASYYKPPAYEDVEREDGSFQPGQWRREPAGGHEVRPPTNLRRIGHCFRDSGLYYRDFFAKYFINEGTVPWQRDLVTKTGRVESSDDSSDVEMSSYSDTD